MTAHNPSAKFRLDDGARAVTDRAYRNWLCFAQNPYFPFCRSAPIADAPTSMPLYAV
jgi:hypothetical protein